MRTEPVLLVHGFTSSFDRNWRDTGWVDLLGDAGREVTGPDLLGHGRADKPHDPAAYDLVAQVRGSLPTAGAVDAVGFSLGARILLAVASEVPDRFARIVVGGVGDGLFRSGEAPGLADAIEAGGDGTGVAGAFVRFAHSPGQDPLALAACMRHPHPALTTEGLGRIACPVLVVLGDQDFARPADRLVEALPDATYRELRNVDHLGTVTAMGFLDAALEFLDAVPA